ncbi:MAG: hypothetical protein LC796_15270 [Acidobacteria bacterium]|nr:hypothetical protein [Acidobacteriota bacterium]MCA1609291.1 hypothetical protein [Acidobacteriota bacterium]
MHIHQFVLPLLLLATALRSPSTQPLACRLDALTTEERERHRSLGETLQRAIAGASELPDGYEVSVDLARLGGAGGSAGLVRLAEWVDLESRCCPFLTFGIDFPGGGRIARLRLTGGEGVKAFLKTEIPQFSRAR